MERLDVRNTQSDGNQHWRTLDRYYSTYWSGLDARVYAGETLLDELIQLQYELKEFVQPVFGYNDYTFRIAMHGQRQVQGSLTINFKRSGYLYQLLRQLSRGETIPDPRTAGPLEAQILQVIQGGQADGDTFLDLALQVGGAAKDRKGRLKVDPGRLEALITDFERAVWQEDPEEAGPRTFDPERLSLQEPRFTDLDAPLTFDLFIQFGSVDPVEIQRRRLVASRGMFPEEKTLMPVFTRKRLVEVELFGESLILDDSGRPIAETYQFLARDAL